MFHIVALTGGRDSAATAVWLSKNRPKPYVYTYCITGAELPETLQFLQNLEKVIGKITYLETPEFFPSLIKKKYFFPSPRRRWCEELLRIRPVNRYIGRQPHVLYLGYTVFNRPKKYARKRQNRIYKYPLVEIKMLSSQEYLDQFGLYNHAYDYGPHQNCWCCFQNGYRTMEKIFRTYPAYREKMKEVIYKGVDAWGDSMKNWGYFCWKRKSIFELIKKLEPNK